MPRATTRLLAALALCALGSAAGCVYQPTEVLVIVDTNAPVDGNLELTASVGLRNSTTPMRRTWVRGPTVPGSTNLPASFAIVPASSDQLNSPVTLGLHLHVDAGSNGSAPVDFDRTARFMFVQHQSTVLRIFLPVECGAPSHGCTTVPDPQCTLAQRCADMGQTCNNSAVCVAPDVTPVSVEQDDGSVNSGVPHDVVRPDVSLDVGVDVTDVTDARDVTRVDVMDVAPRDMGVPPDVVAADTCECTPGATRMSPCGNCGTQTDTCLASCTWGAGTCMNTGVCSPGQTQTVGCGPCATETDTCSSSCAWVAGSCNGSCCTPIAGCTGGAGVGGVCTGDGDDGCGGGCTCNAVNGEQCNVASGIGTCCHMSGWFCSDQSQCCPFLNCIGNICT